MGKSKTCMMRRHGFTTLEHPILVNRPIVCTSKGIKLCRPSEAVLDLIETWPAGPFYKEDGALLCLTSAPMGQFIMIA